MKKFHHCAITGRNACFRDAWNRRNLSRNDAVKCGLGFMKGFALFRQKLTA